MLIYEFQVVLYGAITTVAFDMAPLILPSAECIFLYYFLDDVDNEVIHDAKNNTGG